MGRSVLAGGGANAGVLDGEMTGAAGLGGTGAGNQGEMGKVCHQGPCCAGDRALV